MSCVLVTGGAGFIGSHACRALDAAGFIPVSFDNLSRGHRDAARFGPLCIGDLASNSDLDAAFETHRPDAVLHFAALAYVGESFERPLDYYRTNVGGLINLLEAMARHGVRKLVFSSSCATYGTPETVPISEDTQQRPINPYGASKLMGERIIADAAARLGMSHATLRYFNAAGADPDGTLPERHDPETHLIPRAIDAALKQGEPLQIFGDDYDTEDGTCERDYVHVCDLAEAHVAALRTLDTRSSLTVNLGSGSAVSVLRVMEEVSRVLGRETPHCYKARRSGDPPRLLADISRARALLGFEPRRSSLSYIVETAARARIMTGAMI